MRLGTRRSALALTQAEQVAAMLREAGEQVEIVPLSTSGDRDAPLTLPPPASDKARWVDALEEALHEGHVDIAVHSAKDVPGELRAGLALLSAPPRAAAEDVLCGASGVAELEAGARVGTSSLRRLAQLRAAREDLDVVGLRGNVDTRLRRLREGHEGVTALVLARAGLERLGRVEEITGVLDPERFVPAPGQGAIVLEGRVEDADARRAATAIGDRDALTCLLAERALARALGASCHTPLGAHASLSGEALRMRAWVGLPDGSEWIADEALGEAAEPDALGEIGAQRLAAVGARELLARAEEMAAAGG
jgi:hydroxymethylbilane synthase